jgi:hypothetical protein
VKLNTVRPLAIAALAFASLLANAQSYPPAYKSASTYATGDLVQENGNIYRAIQPVKTASSDPSVDYAHWELYDVNGQTKIVIGVGQPFPDLKTAWNYAQNARIAQSGFIRFFILTKNGPFNESFSQAFSLDHENGANMEIVGDEGYPTLTFTGQGSNGLQIDTNHSFGMIANIQVVSNNHGCNGLYASSNSSITGLRAITISGWSNGVAADQNASLSFDEPTNIMGFTNAGAYATTGATIKFFYGIGVGTFGAASNAPYGLLATYGGQITAQTAYIYGNRIGAYAGYGGHILMDGSNISGCSLYGVAAEALGQISFRQGVANSNLKGAVDVAASGGSVIDAAGSTVSKTAINSNGIILGLP